MCCTGVASPYEKGKSGRKKRRLRRSIRERCNACPSRWMAPLEGAQIVARQRSRVLLPAPLAPTTATSWPAAISIDTSSRTVRLA